MSVEIKKIAINDLTLATGGEVLHLQGGATLLIACYDIVNRASYILLTDQVTINDDLDNLLDRLAKKASVSIRRPEDVVLKIVGLKRLCEHAVQFLRTIRNWQSMAATVEEIGNYFEAYYYNESNRLRIRALETSVLATSTQRNPALGRKCRVMIVDDSKTMRSLLKRIFSEDPDIEVVGETGRPTEAEKLISEIKPDVVSMDINMPEMDGVTLLRKLLPQYPIPTVMITALGIEQGTLVMEALELGAVDYLQKPSSDKMQEFGVTLREKVKMAAKVKVRARKPSIERRPSSEPATRFDADSGIIAIGASTGGTEAIKEILTCMPSKIPPIVIVQHIPPVFSEAFSRRLNELCPFEVREAKDGDQLLPDLVLVAPGGKQMEVVGSPGRWQVKVYDGAKVSGHCPSVDVLFNSVAKTIPNLAVGVLLTGMGSDGAKGLLEMRRAGSRTIAQDEASCIVYGMPRAAVELDAADDIVSLSNMASEILKAFRSLRRKVA